MYSGNNILLITNNETMIGLISPELVQLRNIDSILIRNYENTLSSIETEKPQAIILNCQNNLEESICIDLIKQIKELTGSPIVLVLETYNPKFVKAAYQSGISDCVAIQYGNSEILMRTIWSLQKGELKQNFKKHYKLLEQLGVIDTITGFYTAKHASKVLENELSHFKDRKIDGIFMTIEPNKNSRLKPSADNIIDTIKKNVRNTDTVTHTRNSGMFNILLSNTNLAGALVVWNRLNQTIGAEETLCGFVSDIENKTFEQIEEKIKDGLLAAINSPNLLYVVDEAEKKNDNWLEDMDLPNEGSKNFKLFKQIFKKKMNKIILPTIDEILEEYEDTMPDTEISKEETQNGIEIKLINKKQISEFKIINTGHSTIKLETIHNGLDSPENNSFSIELNELTQMELRNSLEDFLIEFKSCL